MTLAAGSRIGPYEVIVPIGAGGMGEVYRARDTKLDRDVAVKVLPEELASDAERVARFEREAKLLASLNHPNIAGIYGFETDGDMNAIVLELIEGPTLAERIAEGSIPIDEAIAIAKQIAEALEAGHEAGVIHRDLKPANIKVKEDGTVKVLDYGLAKALEGDAPAGADSELSQSPTLTRQGTQVGVILGTAAYMSPEQAKGKKVDRRTDVWAFGAVLYEMLSGKRAFDAEDISDTLAFVLTKEPEWSALPKETPAAVRRVLELCLTKEKAARIPDIGAARLAMEGAFETAPAEAETRTSPRSWLPVATLLLGAAVASVVSWNSKPDADRPVSRFVINPASMPPLGILFPHIDVAITPDGGQVVYESVDGNLMVRKLGSLDVVELVSGDEPLGPFVSPDGRWVAFFTNDLLRKVSLQGGPPVTICPLPEGLPRGGSWGDDDVVVFATSRGLWRVEAAGGEPEPVALPEGVGAYWPEVLPGGGAALVTLMEGPLNDGAEVAVVDLASGETTRLVPGGTSPRYVPTGHIVYGIDGGLRAVSFDHARRQVTSDPVPVLDGVRIKDSGAANFALSATGSLVYIEGGSLTSNRQLVWADRLGNEEVVDAEPRVYRYPRISPDGNLVALDIIDQENDVWTWDFTRETLTRLTFGPAREIYPTWTPNGQRLVFASNREGGNASAMKLFWKAADGTGATEKLSDRLNQRPQAFSPDGTTLVVRDNNQGGNGQSDLTRLSMDEERALEPLLGTEYDENNPDVSSDGRFLAYQSNASGRDEIYVRPFPDVAGGLWQVSQGGGSRPRWSPAGGELFFIQADGRLASVTADPPAFGSPVSLLEKAYISDVGRSYDVSSDGTRFLMLKSYDPAGRNAVPRVILVQNWLEELKRLVPTDN